MSAAGPPSSRQIVDTASIAAALELQEASYAGGHPTLHYEVLCSHLNGSVEALPPGERTYIDLGGPMKCANFSFVSGSVDHVAQPLLSERLRRHAGHVGGEHAIVVAVG